MKHLFLLIALFLTALACRHHPGEPAVNCQEPVDLQAVFSEFETNGKPLANIDFEKGLDPKWTQADFQTLRLILEEANPNIYRYTNQSEMDSIFQSALCKLKDSVSYRDFTQYLATVFNTMACGHSGWIHSKDFRAFRNNAMKFFPFEIQSIKDQYFIVRNNSTDTSLAVGTEILSINGAKPSSINSTLRQYMYRDGNSIPKAETEISEYFPNAYSNFVDDPETFILKARNAEGDVIEKEIAALQRSALDSISLARYGNQQGMGKPLRFEMDTINRVARYTIKWFRNEYIHQQGQNFNSFTDSVFQVLATEDIENLIIDLRGNVGGWTANGKRLFSFFIDETMPFIKKVELSRLDSFSFEPLILSNQGLSDTMQFEQNGAGLYEWENYPNQIVIPAAKNRFKGQVYILTDEETRSCSSVFSAMMRSHTPAIFIGEPCGAAQCGSGGMVMAAMLPYTGITIFTSTARYATNVSDPDNTGGVEVDYRIKPTIQDFLNNDDKQLEFTYDLIRKKGKETDKP